MRLLPAVPLPLSTDKATTHASRYAQPGMAEGAPALAGSADASGPGRPAMEAWHAYRRDGGEAATSVQPVLQIPPPTLEASDMRDPAVLSEQTGRPPYADREADVAGDSLSTPAVGPGRAGGDDHVSASGQMQAHSSTQQQCHPVTAADLVPPGFAQHCAAVALWGNSLRSIWPLVNSVVLSLGTALSRSGAPQLVSWLPGVWHVSS
jgi:hypothetical protein